MFIAGSNRRGRIFKGNKLKMEGRCKVGTFLVKSAVGNTSTQRGLHTFSHYFYLFRAIRDTDPNV